MKTQINKVVFVPQFKSIGFIIDSGSHNGEEWFRTDSDGIRYDDELVFIETKKDYLECKKELKPNEAPSTKKLISEYFKNQKL